MAHPKRKPSRMKVRQRKASKSYKGLQLNKCGTCGEAKLSHQICKKCGTYDGKQVITVVAE